MGDRSLSFYLALVWLFLVACGTVGGGLLPLPAPDRIDWDHLAAAPGVGGHLLGTDNMGRDIAARLLFGGRVSLTVGLVAPCLGLFLGGLLGVLAGFYRGVTEKAIMGGIDAFLAFPRLIFLLVVMFVFGSNLLNVTVALGLVCSPSFARVARANTLVFAEREFVLAARAAGAGDLALILRELLPNVLAPMLVYLLLVVGLVIVAEGSLGFLGLSVPAPTPTWGAMIAEGREVLDQSPHVSLIPTLFMFLTILALNVVGDRLRGQGQHEEGRW